MAQNVSDVAQRLNRRHACGRNIPPLLLMTDAERLPDPSKIIAKLPKGSGIIVRHFSRQGKILLINKIKKLCHKHHVKLLVSDDTKLALSLRLDGVHLSEQNLIKISACGTFQRPRLDFIVTSACHSKQTLQRALKAKVDAVLVSPIFPTQSHPNAKTLGRFGFETFTNFSELPCYALGGLTNKTALKLMNSKVCGFAGISGFV